MEMKIEAGAVLDIASGHELNDARDTILKGAKRERFTLGRGSGTVTGNNSATLQQFNVGPIGGPNTGFIWALDSIVTFSGDDHTLYNPTPGTSFVGGVYVGAYSPDVMGQNLSNLFLPGMTFPNVADFADGQYVRHGETITIRLSATLATGITLGANIWYRQFRESDILEMSGR